MNYIKDHIPKGEKRPGFPMNPQYLTIHSTANLNSTAWNERAWLTNPKNKNVASWHIVVDEKEAIEAIPLTEVAWHAGDGGSGPGNRTSIGIEICESGNRTKTLENAVELVTDLLKKRNWGVDRLRRHYDWSKKICPRIFYDGGKWTGWEQFKQNVQKELSGGSNMAEDKNQPSAWAKSAWEWAKREGYLDGNRPKDPLTREEFAVILKRLVERK